MRIPVLVAVAVVGVSAVSGCQSGVGDKPLAEIPAVQPPTGPDASGDASEVLPQTKQFHVRSALAHRRIRHRVAR
jgi:hypothetical protein